MPSVALIAIAAAFALAIAISLGRNPTLGAIPLRNTAARGSDRVRRVTVVDCDGPGTGR